MSAIQVSSVALVLWQGAAGDDEGFAGVEGEGATVGGGAADGEGAVEDEEKLVLVGVGVPGEVAVDAGYLEVLLVDLGEDAGGTKGRGEGGGELGEGDGSGGVLHGWRVSGGGAEGNGAGDAEKPMLWGMGFVGAAKVRVSRGSRRRRRFCDGPWRGGG